MNGKGQMVIQRRQNKQKRIPLASVSGASSLSVAVGNSAILKASTKKSGNSYLVTITGVNQGSTGIYTILPGQKGICQCVVTVKPEKITFGYQNSNYGCTDSSRLEYIRQKAAAVRSRSTYAKTLADNETYQAKFESFYGVPYSSEWSEITAIRACFAASGTGSASGGSAYDYYTGANKMCADEAKALEAALHCAGYNARLAAGTRSGSSHMWCQVLVDGQWYNLTETISTSVNSGYTLSSTGYNI